MPVRRRLRKRGTADRLTEIQRLHLHRGNPFGCGPVFADNADEREAWTAHRDDIQREHIERMPGTRPCAWWRYDAPHPRDEKIHETIQLHELGLIGAAELEALTVQWRHWERVARYREAEYADWREWAGTPHWFRECEPDTDQTDESVT